MIPEFLRLKWWAVLVGAAVDLISSLVLGVAFTLVKGMPSSPADWMVMMAVGLLTVVAGGATAAAIAGDRALDHGLAVGGMSCLTGLVFLFAPSQGAPLWYTVSGFVFVLPSGALGGYLVARRQRQAHDG